MDESGENQVENKVKSRSKMTKRTGLMDYFKDYCEYTGIHGFCYIGEDRTLLER